MLDGLAFTLYNVDLQLFCLINLYYHPIFLDDLVANFTLAGILPFWGIVCVLLFVSGGEKGKKVAILTLMALLLGFALSELFKYFIARPRPFYDVKAVMVTTENGFSFPSGHSTIAFAACTLLGLEYGYLYLFIAFASLIALSRVYLGVHYPSDVVAGALLGVFCAFLVYKEKEEILRSMLRFKNSLMHRFKNRYRHKS
ncbi:MAG: hypothetical protein BME94_03870 [Methanobacteriales archaeon Met13]